MTWDPDDFTPVPRTDPVLLACRHCGALVLMHEAAQAAHMDHHRSVDALRVRLDEADRERRSDAREAVIRDLGMWFGLVCVWFGALFLGRTS